MAAKKGGLGRGLEALFEDNATENGGEVDAVSIGDIEPDRGQPRKYFDQEALTELAHSIAQHGVIQPILVRPKVSGGYTIVAGERRWRAARIAGLTEIPVIVREMADKDAAEIALIENLQREDLNPIEEALGYRTLMDNYGLTQEGAAERVGKSRPAVANALRLLALPQDVIELTKEGKLSAGHARALAGMGDPQSVSQAAQKIVSGGLSVRETEKLVKSMDRPKSKQNATKIRLSIYDEVEISLRDALGRRVTVSPRGEGGTIQIEFLTKDELIAIANRLGKE